MVAGRQHPILSPVALLSAFVLLAGVGVSLYFTGGSAFSPGPLSAQAVRQVKLGGFASHAAFENDCSQCHTPMRGVEAVRCEACHADIGAERAGRTGLHGRLVGGERCGTCHLDHRGRAFDTAAAGLANFDHATTGFSLARHAENYDGSAMDCAACHTAAGYAVGPTTCYDCHAGHAGQEMADHQQAFGADCTACHDGVDKTSKFDHAKTHFPLEGAHSTLACLACHQGSSALQDTPVACGGCHAEPQVHAGEFSTQCDECHSTSAWKPARLAGAAFDHAKTRFHLDTHRRNYDGRPFTCGACHAGAGGKISDITRFSDQACVNCHVQGQAAFMTKHLQTFGRGCRDCHDGTGNTRNFDHNTVFVLDGAHAPLQCAACHVDHKFKGLGKDCVSCHAEPQIHQGVFGTDCAACHTTSAWAPAALREHRFPIDHGGQMNACATCHTTSYTTYTCYTCHEHDPDIVRRQHAEQNLTQERLADCVACHATGE